MHTLSRIVATNDPTQHRYIWSDDSEHTLPADWLGFYRGADGEYWDNKDGEGRWGVGETVVSMFIAQGGEVEPYVPGEDE